MRRSTSIVRVEGLLGRQVVAADGQRVGRIEEVRAVRRGDVYEVTEYLLGPGALAERLSVVHRLFGRKPRTYIAEWDKLDVRSRGVLRLTCSVESLKIR